MANNLRQASKCKKINKKDEDIKMDNFEKVEKLVEKAHVSYEDAKKALDEANGDILDAMIILEKQGKVSKPEQTIYTTRPEDNVGYKDVPAAVEDTKKDNGKGFFKTIGDGIKRGFQYTVDNSLKVTRRGETVLNIPLWISIILVLCAWHLLLVVFVISLFLECRYSIEGKDNAREVNDILNQASDLADKAKESFTSDNSSVNEATGYTAPAGESVYRTQATVDNSNVKTDVTVENADNNEQ